MRADKPHDVIAMRDIGQHRPARFQRWQCDAVAVGEPHIAAHQDGIAVPAQRGAAFVVLLAQWRRLPAARAEQGFGQHRGSQAQPRICLL